MSTNSDWNKPIDLLPVNILKMPSFVRLFVIHRVLNNANYNSNDSINIDTVVSESTLNKALHSSAQQILSQLMKHGIKDYMNKHYKEKNQANTIEIIFNQIILKQFTKEYQNVTLYPTVTIAGNTTESSDENKTNYQNLLFNTTDIMCSMFQYFSDFNDNNEYIGDLSNCSLVCSQWFYHAFNPNSIYQNVMKTVKTT